MYFSHLGIDYHHKLFLILHLNDGDGYDGDDAGGNAPSASVLPPFRPLDQRCLAIIVSLTDAPLFLSLPLSSLWLHEPEREHIHYVCGGDKSAMMKALPCKSLSDEGREEGNR